MKIFRRAFDIATIIYDNKTWTGGLFLNAWLEISYRFVIAAILVDIMNGQFVKCTYVRLPFEILLSLSKT